MKKIWRLHLSLACLGLLICPSTARSNTGVDVENSVQCLSSLLWNDVSSKGELNQEAFPVTVISLLQAMEPEWKVITDLPGTALLEEFITTHETFNAAKHNISLELNRFHHLISEAGAAGDLMLFKAEQVRDEGGRIAQNTRKLSAANTQRTYAATRLDTAILNALEYATIIRISTCGLLHGDCTAVRLLYNSSANHWHAADFLITPYLRGGYLVGTVSD